MKNRRKPLFSQGWRSFFTNTKPLFLCANQCFFLLSKNRKKMYNGMCNDCTFFIMHCNEPIKKTYKIKYIILMDSLSYAKSSLIWVFSRSFSVLCAPFSMFDGPGGTCYSKMILDHQNSYANSNLWKNYAIDNTFF